MSKKYRKKKYQKNVEFKSKNHIDPMKSIFATVFAVFFAIANACMWIGIKGCFVWLIVIGGISVALCIFLAIYKWARAYRGFNGAYRRKEY